ncbi:hypothetical protein ABH905_001030 [Pseudomonas frederiksbergensis]
MRSSAFPTATQSKEQIVLAHGDLGMAEASCAVRRVDA